MSSLPSFIHNARQYERCQDLTEEALLSRGGVVWNYETTKERYDVTRGSHYDEPCLRCRVIWDRDTRSHWLTSVLQIHMRIEASLDRIQQIARLVIELEDDDSQIIN
jgi:hypothetical protein